MEQAAFYSDKFLSEQRQVGDVKADAVVIKYFSNLLDKQKLREWLHTISYNQQLSALPNAYQDEILFAEATQLPVWANRRLMQQGAAFFARYANFIMNMLGLLSLPYCYAAADGARVLYLSDRMRADTAKRLHETGEFVWEVMAPNAFEYDGKGFASISKVRLMHAAVRYYTLHSGKWNNAWGLPVNQEDMAGTNLSFSLIVIRGLRKLDIAITYEDQQAFMHLWNVIGHLSGIQDSLLPQDGKQAIELERSIVRRQFKVSEQGRELTRALMEYFKSIKMTDGISAGDMVQLMRYLLGDEIAGLLAVPEGNTPYAVINLLKATGTFQELKPLYSVRSAYRDHYMNYRQQDKGTK